jgi:hypothetical protein
MCLRERFALPAHRPDRGLVPHRAPQRAAGAWNETGSVTFRVRSMLSQTEASAREEHRERGYRMNLG